MIIERDPRPMQRSRAWIASESSLTLARF